MSKFPRDPLASRHPEPMDAGSARREVVRAAKLRRRVPLSHPYGVVPLWTPYAIATAVGRFCARFERARPAIVLEPLAAEQPLKKGSE